MRESDLRAWSVKKYRSKHDNTTLVWLSPLIRSGDKPHTRARINTLALLWKYTINPNKRENQVLGKKMVERRQAIEKFFNKKI